MKKCILLILMSGILFGSKVVNTNVEKTSKNAEVYHAPANLIILLLDTKASVNAQNQSNYHPNHPKGFAWHKH